MGSGLWVWVPVWVCGSGFRPITFSASGYAPLQVQKLSSDDEAEVDEEYEGEEPVGAYYDPELWKKQASKPPAELPHELKVLEVQHPL